MKRFLVVLTAGLLTSIAAMAQPAPAQTATCKDGTTYSGASKKGACSGHGGVKEWAAKPAAASAPMSAAPAASAGGPGKASAPATPASPATPAATAAPKKAAAPAAGGPGQVWVNKDSKVYHCSGSRWYGKTKNGEYMTEAQATSQGFHPDHGKACG